MTQAWRLDKEIRNISDRSLLKHIVTELTDFFFFFKLYTLLVKGLWTHE